MERSIHTCHFILASAFDIGCAHVVALESSPFALTRLCIIRAFYMESWDLRDASGRYCLPQRFFSQRSRLSGYRQTRAERYPVAYLFRAAASAPVSLNCGDRAKPQRCRSSFLVPMVLFAVRVSSGGVLGESRGLAKMLQLLKRLFGKKVDIVIITVKEEEYKAVIDRLPNWKTLPRSNRTYNLGKIKRNVIRSRDGENYSVAVVRLPEQGVIVATNTTRDAIADLEPNWIVLVGIAGSLPHNEFTLGDVVVATRLHDFTVGAFIEGSRPEFRSRGGAIHKVIQDLIGFLPSIEPSFVDWKSPSAIGIPRPSVDRSEGSLYGDEPWRQKIRSNLTRNFWAEGHRTTPMFTTQAIAGTSFLIKDTQLIEQWREQARDLGAVEMELPGVYEAAHQKHREYPVLAIRGISDIVGLKRETEWTSYACQTAASFCISLLENLPAHFLRDSCHGAGQERQQAGKPPIKRPLWRWIAVFLFPLILVVLGYMVYKAKFVPLSILSARADIRSIESAVDGDEVCSVETNAAADGSAARLWVRATPLRWQVLLVEAPVGSEDFRFFKEGKLLATRTQWAGKFRQEYVDPDNGGCTIGIDHLNSDGTIRELEYTDCRSTDQRKGPYNTFFWSDAPFKQPDPRGHPCALAPPRMGASPNPNIPPSLMPSLRPYP